MAESLPLSEGPIDPRFVGRERQPGLDLLRALAIVVVVFYHAALLGFELPGKIDRFGWVGVDLFFVLSGYLIGGQLLKEIDRRGTVRLRRFFSRRALRIMPAYFVILAFYFALLPLREGRDIAPLWMFLLSVQNFTLHGSTAFSHSWSLAVEDQFYLLLPLLLLLLVRFRQFAIVVPCAIFIGGIVLRASIAASHPGADGGVSFLDYQRLIYYPTWGRLDPLALGVVLAAVEIHRPQTWQRITDQAPWLWLAAFLILAAALSMGGKPLTIAECSFQFPLIALAMAALLVCAVSPRLPFQRLNIPGAAFIASISYSVYLSHKLVSHGVARVATRFDLPLTSPLAHLLVEGCIYAAGALLFLSVERPFLRLRQRVAR